jgi:DNA polymerase III delta prime subunit
MEQYEREAQPPPQISTEGGAYVEGDVHAGIFVGRDYIVTPAPLSPADAQERRNLRILLEKVRQFWVEGVLEKSVHGALLIELGKETRPEAIEHPWEMVMELPDQARQTLPPDEKIGDIFDEVNRALLILGEPGSGKTITMLELARDLVARAESAEDFSQPVPVVFNLSTWTDKRQPLIDWLVDELLAKYQIPKRIARPWLESNRILPLLDGLDEVRPEIRAACVEAINQFGESFGLAGLAVCSRLQEYTVLPVRLRLNGAICLQSLTPGQVDGYLAAAGPRLAALRTTLREDGTLQTLTRSPLMLSVMSLAYQDIPLEALADQALDTAEERSQHLLDTYIERMFKRKGERDKPYTDEQTTTWLSWLAQRMIEHNQSIFLIEQLQPGWLLSRTWRWVYTLASRLIGGLIVGSAVRLIFMLIFTWLGIGVIGGLTVGLIDTLRFERSGKDITVRKAPTLWQSVFNILVVALIVGLIFGLLGLILGRIDWLTIGLILGLVFGLIFGSRASRQSLTNDIQTVEALNWSWGRALKGIAFGLGVVLIFGLGVWLSSGLIWGLRWGLLIGGPIGAMFGGINSSVVETKTAPNQGIRLSLRNAVFTGLIFVLVFVLIVVGLTGGLSGGPRVGLGFGLLAALWYGGLDIIQHYTLRLILYLKGYIPRNYAHFLDYAAERVFLQKVGGSYIFIHRLLLEHFAAMSKTS